MEEKGPDHSRAAGRVLAAQRILKRELRDELRH